MKLGRPPKGTITYCALHAMWVQTKDYGLHATCRKKMADAHDQHRLADFPHA